MDEVTHQLLRASSEKGTGHDLTAMFEQLSEAARKLLDSEICSIFLHDPDRGELFSLVQQKAPGEIRFPDSEGIAGQVFWNQEPVAVQDASGDERFFSRIDEKAKFEIRSLMALPLSDLSGKPIGVVEAINKQGGGAFTASDMTKLQSVNAYINDFLENIVLYRRLKKAQEAVIHRLSRASGYKDQETEKHTRIGHDILAGADNELTDLAAVLALEHHERWDGKGYPDGKKGSGISLEAQITSAADVLDTICSKRSFKDARPFDEAITELVKCKGTQFAPAVVEVIVRERKNLKTILNFFADAGTVSSSSGRGERGTWAGFRILWPTGFHPRIRTRMIGCPRLQPTPQMLRCRRLGRAA